jgi:hypothetical protein
MQAGKTQLPSAAIAAESRALNAGVPAGDNRVYSASEEPSVRDRAAGDNVVVHDPYEDEAISDEMGAADGNAVCDNHRPSRDGATDAADGPALLWTMDEETVLLHSSEASLKHIRTRLEHLLLGVSHALRTREIRGESQDPHDGSRSGSAARSRSRPSMDFAEMVLAADHAVRRIVGEAFVSFEENEVVQMVQLCSLADRGPADCDELVRNAVVVLQALTRDGEAVRNVEQFREFITKHRAEIASEQWRHDYVTAIRSLAVGFLRDPVAITASYGSSMLQIVEHEALYVGLLRICGERPVGNTPHPKEIPATLHEALLSLQQHAAKANSASKARTTPTNRKHSSTYIHTPKCANKSTHARRSSTSQQQQQQSALPSAEDLLSTIDWLVSRSSTSPTSPPKKTSSRLGNSKVGPTPSQLHELQKSTSLNDSTMVSERRASVCAVRMEKPKSTYEPVPEVPQRLSLHRRPGQSMSHY